MCIIQRTEGLRPLRDLDHFKLAEELADLDEPTLNDLRTIIVGITTAVNPAGVIMLHGLLYVADDVFDALVGQHASAGKDGKFTGSK